MNIIKRQYDTHKELLVKRYKSGIMLDKPTYRSGFKGTSIADIYAMNISCFFLSGESVILDGNDKIAATVGADSVNDMSGHHSSYFCQREFSDRMVANDQAVMRSAMMKVVEESGGRADNFLINALAFKLPWYYEDRVIGVLGCSLHIDTTSLNEFTKNMLRLMQTGLLGDYISPQSTTLTTFTSAHGYLSGREIDVLRYLVQGKSAKVIGELLKISRRTVEHHIENIKFKSDCYNKYELIIKYKHFFDANE